MTYKTYEELTVLNVMGSSVKVPFERVIDTMLSRPSNIIYCETDGQLSGIISMGDVARASEQKQREVRINQRFMRVRASEYMKARNIFADKKNINAIPIVNETGALLGEWSRWDDYHMASICLCAGKHFFLKDKRLILVRPDVRLEKKSQIFRQWYQYLLSQGAQIECIERMQIVEYLDDMDCILFLDEDELRTMDTLLTFVWNKEFERKRFKTYRRFMGTLKRETFESYLRGMEAKGIKVLNLFFSRTEYYQNLWNTLWDRFCEFGKAENDRIPSELREGFFFDLYTEEYAEQIVQLPFQLETKSGIGKVRDIHNKYCNVTNGVRHTVGQSEAAVQTIWFFGPCLIYGAYVEDKYTIESLLQKCLIQSRYNVQCMNCGVPGARSVAQWSRMIDMPLKKGDVVVLYSMERAVMGISNLDLSEILEKHDVNTAWMVKYPSHCNHKVNSIYANEIFTSLSPFLVEGDVKEYVGQDEPIEKDSDFVKEIYVNCYFSDFDGMAYGKVGAIVMNCNPFTYGHRYLIEQALKMVDFLIIFVVEEDRSVFSFAERFAMVCEGISDLENVKVVPSGPFILSQTTFPEYFVKETDEDIVENVENDITLFADRIAPYLNIHYRFVGEEPDDVVTNEYNSAMKRILPKKGIELVEIPRKSKGGRCISASRVRKALEENDMEELERLVPKSTSKLLLGG